MCARARAWVGGVCTRVFNIIKIYRSEFPPNVTPGSPHDIDIRLYVCPLLSQVFFLSDSIEFSLQAIKREKRER